MKIAGLFFLCVMFINTLAHSGELSYEQIKNSYLISYQHEAQKKITDAINDLKPVYLNYPKTYTVNYRLGWLYYLNKNYANAVTHLQKAISISPMSMEVMNTLALVHAVKANWEELEILCVKIQKIDYYNRNANYWYAHTLKMQGKYGLAVKVARKMLAVYPTSISFLQILGENLYFGNYKKESASVFYNLLILSPESKTALEYLSKIEEGKS